MDGVILGMPGPWADSNNEAADIYTSKIGGLPDWPFPIVSEKQNLLECSACRSNLCLLAQIYAPISSKSLSIEERVIYVFGCLVPDCENLIWRAFRVQKVSSNEVAQEPASSISNSNNDWQKDLWSFSGRENDDDDDDDMDMEEFARALSEAANLNSTVKSQNNGAESSRKPLPTSRPARSIDDKIPVLPCFYIHTREEKRSKQAASGSSKTPLLSVQECDYGSEDRSNGETYEEENYEYDRALNADRTYLKFKKRMDAYPEQCFRYSYGGKPLVASGEIGDPGICKHCGGSRHYEMQLMPPLIFFLQEAANDQQKTSLQKFDWMTLLVYTCSKSCVDWLYQVKSGGEDWIVAEEAVIVQCE
ncbi:programmed cell death protein 2-like [Phtheirospermum japonicum]|uniref:Programmed cell death protein 2-like n=1 Tax=Phtheirospermum japonicum TaxID=374723 RepID=A0A830DBU4_9LAMI|nr:programmed cell death protein 2-like [Phtheirospermum japonicum]